MLLSTGVYSTFVHSCAVYYTVNHSSAVDMAAFPSKITKQLTTFYLSRFEGDQISAQQLQLIYNELRSQSSLSLRQVNAAIETVCLCPFCFKEEVFEVLQEMDRRYFLMRDLEWEFALLDREGRESISEDDAKFLVRAVHGHEAPRIWQRFVLTRELQGPRITLAEIEVFLCELTSDEP